METVNKAPGNKPVTFTNLERRPDGTLVAYIAFWRYIIFGLLYAAGFYISLKGFIILYQQLPPYFWKHWDKAATVTLVCLILVIAFPFMAFNLLKSGYKKIQLEINKNSVRYLKSATKGGTLLSDNYDTINFEEIISIGLRQNPFGGGILDVSTSVKKHSIMLLLSVAEQMVCYRTLEEATNRRENKKRRSYGGTKNLEQAHIKL